MKKIIKLLTGTLLTALLLFSASCKKSDPGPSLRTSTQWTFDGISYNSTTTSVNSVQNSYFGTDGSGNNQPTIDILFGSGIPSDGTYTYNIADASAPLSSIQCRIEVETTNSIWFTSVAGTGNIVTVKVSGGKVTAALKNVTVANYNNGTTLKSVSGTLVQNQ